MSKGAKILVVIAVLVTVMFVGTGLLIAGSIVHSGVVTVKINETRPNGTTLYLPVPAALVYLGMDLLPLVDDGGLDELRADLGEWRPFVAATLEDLEDCPDAVLVDVRDGDETVRIVKQGLDIEIRIHGADGNFEISLPARLFSRVARAMA
ncbi:MAG TPA: hypothetical protein VF756_23515 [Thermoanaerobaculia bacterium]